VRDEATVDDERVERLPGEILEEAGGDRHLWETE
jgi:hypothetical protein